MVQIQKNVTFMLCPQICGNGGEIKVENIIISLKEGLVTFSMYNLSRFVKVCAFLKLNVVQLPKTRFECSELLAEKQNFILYKTARMVKDLLRRPEVFLKPCKEEVDEVMISGAADIGLPEGMHML